MSTTDRVTAAEPRHSRPLPAVHKQQLHLPSMPSSLAMRCADALLLLSSVELNPGRSALTTSTGVTLGLLNTRSAIHKAALIRDTIADQKLSTRSSRVIVVVSFDMAKPTHPQLPCEWCTMYCTETIDQSTVTVSIRCYHTASASTSPTSWNAFTSQSPPAFSSSQNLYCGRRHTGPTLFQVTPTTADKVLTTTCLKSSPTDVLPTTLLRSSVDVQVLPKLQSLGITIDSHLRFDCHAKEVARACNYHTRALHHVRTLLTDDLAQTEACNIVGSRLDYCNALLYGATFDIPQ